MSNVKMLLRPGRQRVIRGEKILVGCGPERLEGWINVDRVAGPGVDLIMDVTEAFPFEDATHVYAEHFLEHLDLDQALVFLSIAHGALREGGHLHVSTPNLDWVWAHTYDTGGPPDRARACLWANRSFYDWGHRFLWNRSLLQTAMETVGFDRINWCQFGESAVAELVSIEQHEPYPDKPDLPHVLIAEARKGRPDEAARETLDGLIETEFLRHLER